MGMFDFVNVPEPIQCPQCGAPLSGWQSKDADCLMEMVELSTVLHFYTACRKCNSFIEYFRKQKSGEVTIADFELLHREEPTP